MSVQFSTSTGISNSSDPCYSNDCQDKASKREDGLGVGMTSLLLGAQMAGAGFLSLPKGIANTGWIGVVLMLMFCLGVGFSGTRLGRCWVVLEQRWPQRYGGGSRQPYMDIAYEALGRPGWVVAMVAVFLSLFGATNVFLLLTAAFLNNLVSSLSVCVWVLIVAAVVLPFTWLGTPKDFWQASVLAGVCTVVACIIIFIELLIEAPSRPIPDYRNPTLFTFALGFASILFAFGGASVFPTIQNDMKDRTLFGRSITITFTGLLLVYMPVAVTGYALSGFDVNPNILVDVDTSKVVIKVAIGMEVLNLLGTYVIAVNPLFQGLEEQFNIKNKFGWRRCVLRTLVVGVQVIFGLAVPSFDKILNLVGASMVMICTFLLPTISYLRLEYSSVPLWEKTLLVMIVIVGLVGGVISTVSSIMDIVNIESMGESCFM